MKLYRNIALCSSLVVVTGISPSPDSRLRTHQSAAASITQGDPKLRIERGAHKRGELVHRFASFLGWTVLNANHGPDSTEYDRINTGLLSLGKQESIDVLSQLLFAKNLILVPLSVRDKTYELISLVGARRNEVVSRAMVMKEAAVLTHRNRYMPVVTTIELKHLVADVAEVRTILFSMTMAVNSTQMWISTKDRSVTLHGLAPVVATSIEILRAIDKPARPEAGLPTRLKDIEDRLSELEHRIK